MTISRSAFLNSGFPQANSMAEKPSFFCQSPKNLCTLRWRQDKLWVKQSVKTSDQIPLPALAKPEWFRSCLARSKASAVCVDPSLGDQAVWMWTRACHEAQKPLYLRVPKYAHLPRQKRPVAWLTKRVFDYIAASLLLLVLSPLMIAIAGLIWISDRKPVFNCYWRIGERGRLFRICKFRTESNYLTQSPRTTDTDSSVTQKNMPIGGWLRQTHLDMLPVLLNVIKGDISIVGPHPWSVNESVTLPQNLKPRLNMLPGITGTWQVFSCQQKEFDFPKLADQDLKLFHSWSLSGDLTVLLRTFLEILTGERLSTNDSLNSN